VLINGAGAGRFRDDSTDDADVLAVTVLPSDNGKRLLLVTAPNISIVPSLVTSGIVTAGPTGKPCLNKT
jgi:hypothetical protein